MDTALAPYWLRAVRVSWGLALLGLLGACANQPGAGSLADEQEYQQWVEQAQQHWNHSEYGEAISTYEKALAVRDTTEVRFALASLALATNRFARAQHSFETLLRDNPDNIDVREGLAVALLKQGEIEDALQQFKAVHNLAQGRPLTLNYLGVIGDLRGEFEQAGIYYRQALNAQPDNPAFMNNYGYSQLMLKNYGEAERWFQRALEHKSGDAARIVNNLSITYARQGRYEQAITLLSSTGDDPVVLNNVGYIAMLNGDYRKAVAYLERAMELSPHYYATAAGNLSRAKAKLAEQAE